MGMVFLTATALYYYGRVFQKKLKVRHTRRGPGPIGSPGARH